MKDLHCFGCDSVRPVVDGRVEVCCDDPMIGAMRPTHVGEEKQWPEWVSGVMHKNSLEGVERAFSAAEWDAAEQEVLAGNNFGWSMIVRRAVHNIRGGWPGERDEDEDE